MNIFSHRPSFFRIVSILLIVLAGLATRPARAGRVAPGDTPDGLNAAQQWRAAFDGAGVLVTPQSGAWTWGLALSGYGRAGAARTLPDRAALSAEGGRVSAVWTAGLTEWWRNDARGLEHGFTVHARPGGRGDLLLTLATRGGLRPQVDADGRSVMFTDAQGAAVVRYAGLTAFDALGRTLPARLEADGHTLRMVVDDAQTAYPLTIDPWVQQAYLKASNAEAYDFFGSAVAVDGDTVVAGAYREAGSAAGGEGDNSASKAGAAYVFVVPTPDPTPTPAQYTLTVQNVGGGNGTVTSSPAGIDCGSACSADFAPDTVVTLTASVELWWTDIFSGWSGACSGTQSTCDVTMDAAQSVTAPFVPRDMWVLDPAGRFIHFEGNGASIRCAGACSSAVLTLTVKNVGRGTLNLTGTDPVTISGETGPFQVTTQPVLRTLTAGQTTDFVITFTNPGDGMPRLITVRIANDNADENPYTVRVVGNPYTILWTR